MSDESIDPWYARFVKDRGCIRADGSVKHQAFLETRPPHNVSVNRHDRFMEDIHWEVGAIINPTRPLLGAADISKSGVAAAQMSVEETHDPDDPPYHAEIYGWNMADTEEGKHERIEQAHELADRSRFVPVSRNQTHQTPQTV